MRYIIPFVILSISFFGCEKFDVHDVPINGISYSLGYDSIPSFPYPYLSYDNAEWSLNTPPYSTSDSIRNSTSYFGELKLWNHPGGANGGLVSLHHRISELGESHQVFYEVSDSLNLAIMYSDFDCNGFPIGIKTNVVSGTPSTGTLKITLIHNPNKNGVGVAEGNISNAGGTEEYSYTFNVAIR